MAGEQSTVETLVSVVPAPEAGPDVFTNEHLPWNPGEGRGLFGGFLVAHAVRAAQASAPPSFDVHSLQSVFLRPGRRLPRILYRVERVADGRTFATRLVRAEQDGRCLYTATIGLQRRDGSGGPAGGGGGGGGPDGSGTAAATDGRVNHARPVQYATPMPELGPDAPARPEDVSEENTRRLLEAVGFADDAWDSREDAPPMDPFDWRHLPWTPSSSSSSSSPPADFRLRSFVRAPPLSGEAGPDVHLAVLAFLSDELLIATPNLAAPAALVGARSANVAFQVSVSHSLLFHEAAALRVDAWMLCERSTSWAGAGRVLVEQRLWDRDSGRLLVSGWQEGLLRLKNGANL